MMQKSTTFTTIFRVKKCYFHYDFACKKVPLSLRYAKKYLPHLKSQLITLTKFDFTYFRFIFEKQLEKYIITI
jgi:hypothetical protein